MFFAKAHKINALEDSLKFQRDTSSRYLRWYNEATNKIVNFDTENERLQVKSDGLEEELRESYITNDLILRELELAEARYQILETIITQLNITVKQPVRKKKGK